MQRVLGGSQRQGPWWSNPGLQKLALGTWNFTSLTSKELELVREVEKFRLDIVGLTSMEPVYSRGWTIFHSGVGNSKRRWAGVAILVALRLSTCRLALTH